MEQIKILEQNRAQMVADEYRNRGYEVIHAPDKDQLPDFLKEFRPDLIVRKGDESIVVEVKSRRTLSQNPQIREMARILGEKKDWKLELFLVGIGEDAQFAEGVQPLNEQDVLQGTEQARKLLNAGFPEASLLYAWSVAEAAIRLIVQKEAITVKSDAPLYLIKALATEGVISKDEYELLMSVVRTRNAVAHGYRMTEYNPDMVEDLIHTTEKLLKSQPDALPASAAF
ncbi:DUF86 domain-containing protein [Desulfobacterales bacterium HSG2]|nr:DUF86 domain-containing protein [Desulfobacterales bacterium HSG2]